MKSRLDVYRAGILLPERILRKTCGECGLAAVEVGCEFAYDVGENLVPTVNPATGTHDCGDGSQPHHGKVAEPPDSQPAPGSPDMNGEGLHV